MPRAPRISCAILILWILVSLLGCQAAPERPLWSGDDLPKGWALEGENEVYTPENLYDLVNGQAESFFAYGFENVSVQSARWSDGTEVRIELWKLDEPANAYGLYTASIAGEPIALGNDGDADPGRRILFWQDRYVTQIVSRQPLPADVLPGLGEALSKALPAGGERPGLLARLPQGGRDEGRPLFFHNEISLQNELWLGGDNPLGLGPEADGLWAGYRLGDRPCHLLLIHFPEASAAAQALVALHARPPEGLVVAQAVDNLLGAVFGEVDEGTAMALLRAALS